MDEYTKKQNVNERQLSDALQEKLEHKSSVTLDDVRVHYNSDKPVHLDAKSYV